MPHLSFITPVLLLLLAIVPLVWALALLTPRRLSPLRFWLGLIVRSVMLIALTLGLAGAQLVRPVQTLTTVFLIDASDSVAPAQVEQSTNYVNAALKTMPAGDRAAVVVFGAHALVEHAPAALATIGKLTSVPVTTRTNIQDAIQFGLALLPADSRQRLVLISDGGENSGNAADAARLAAARHVPLDVVIQSSAQVADVMVSALEAPSTAREGQQIAASVLIHSSLATTGKLHIFIDNQLASTQAVTLVEGLNTVQLHLPAGETGFRRLEVVLEAQGDSEPRNNRAAAFTQVQGPPRMLVIASDPNRATNLQSALASAGVRVDVRTPNQSPVSLAELSAYAAVILVDTPARDMPQELLETIPAYVRDLGRGFAMIGGADSFGAGGYRRVAQDANGSSIEDVLPVSLDPLDTASTPDVALAMVIDRSGSMGETSGNGRSKLDLAKEAVYQASLGLATQDQIELSVFDDQAQVVLPLQKLPTLADIQQALGSFDTGGGTDIRPALEQVSATMATAKTKIKHVILLTDGLAPSNYSDLVTYMRNEQVTISTVAIGDDADPNLASIANLGGGRYYQVKRVEEVPSIFLQETVIVAGRDIIEGQFTPAVALSAPIVRGLNGLPALYGYNGTEIKAAARSILVTPDGKPILAQWQYGLGRAVAWTSDFKGQWGRDWVNWAQFPTFVAGFADLLMPPVSSSALDVRTSNVGSQSVIELAAQDTQGQPLNNLALQGNLIDPELRTTQLQFTQVGAGEYRAVTDTETPGVYLVQVGAGSADGQSIGTATSGLVVSYSPEYSQQRSNPQLLRDLAGMTNGRVNPAESAVFDTPVQSVGRVSEIGLPLLGLALLLWPLDIALRRLYVRWDTVLPIIASWRSWRRAQLPAASDATMARLNAAKRRAQTQTGQSILVPQAHAETSAATRRVPVEAPKPAPSPVLPTSASAGDDQFARLIAAKQRARKRRDE